MTDLNPAQLTLGPNLFNLAPEAWRDFYFRIADEAPIDTVYVGEVVCSKRTPFFAPVLPEVVERLLDSGKGVVISTLGLIMNRRELEQLRETAEDSDILIEANDIAAASLLRGQAHVIGPGVNVYNEGTMQVLAEQGAVRFCLPGELAADSIRVMAGAGLAETEVQVFGRLPLAISARCYHARQRGWEKDSCQYACADDPDGMDLDTLYGAPFLAVNGTQTLSHTCCNLLAELDELRSMGVGHFRLSPQDTDMIAVARLFRAVLDGEMEAEAAEEKLAELVPAMPFANGFYYGEEGMAFLAAAQGE